MEDEIPFHYCVHPSFVISPHPTSVFYIFLHGHGPLTVEELQAALVYLCELKMRPHSGLFALVYMHTGYIFFPF